MIGENDDYAKETISIRPNNKDNQYRPQSFTLCSSKALATAASPTTPLISDLAHGYVITIHRSQGSEYPFVIIPIYESQSAMLSRELLYTAITRASWMVVLIGSRRAIAQAIKNSHNHRHTGLKDLLTSSAKPSTLRKAA
jgi:UvrD-like helicase C-terminal domain